MRQRPPDQFTGHGGVGVQRLGPCGLARPQPLPQARPLRLPDPRDVPAAAATAGEPLRLTALYQGQGDPARLRAARKLSATHYVGDVARERCDWRVERHPDGRVAQTVVFLYDGHLRVADAPSGAPLRRQPVCEGALA
jgi:hypothetical protein